MDRFNLKCNVEGGETELQFDKKAMPGEAGPCFMITANGSFKGYIARDRSGGFKALGSLYYTISDLTAIESQLKEHLKSN